MEQKKSIELGICETDESVDQRGYLQIIINSTYYCFDARVVRPFRVSVKRFN